ncbi:cupin domain-containing protein [Tumebacillus sp. DT12]|uniref:Cupin domain-containing protein n=1 Tax=Tumebacillus lacus TaxID=2995335 RepID=A0ABT3X1F9_9BACL|nr:cupin domain-containing protein [Tumebacillus lacus]MCX7569395.1 cupin domain-containing protein [Tumebacillus lacus]
MTTTKNSLFFPEATLEVSETGIRTYSTVRGDTEIKFSYIPPGASVPMHDHQEVQIGMVVQGELTMTVGGVTRVMTAENEIYVAPPFCPHAAVNESDGETIAIDIKRFREGENYTHAEGYFREKYNTRDLIPGMEVTFFLEDWMELMIADIPANGGEMPDHKHKNEQLGICIGGSYPMVIENETHMMKVGDSYFCGARERHSAVNPFDVAARSINVFLPPRYNLHELKKNK